MSADPTAEHIDAAHHITALQTESGWLHICQVCKEATFFQPPPLPCPGPVVPAAALAASLPTEVMLAALVDRGTLTAEDAPIARHGGYEHTHWQQRWDGRHTHEGRRFVTPWEVAE